MYKKPSASTGIDGHPTRGYGRLDEHGFWQFPVSLECGRCEAGDWDEFICKSCCEHLDKGISA